VGVGLLEWGRIGLVRVEREVDDDDDAEDTISLESDSVVR